MQALYSMDLLDGLTQRVLQWFELYVEEHSQVMSVHGIFYYLIFVLSSGQ